VVGQPPHGRAARDTCTQRRNSASSYPLSLALSTPPYQNRLECIVLFFVRSCLRGRGRPAGYGYAIRGHPISNSCTAAAVAQVGGGGGRGMLEAMEVAMAVMTAAAVRRWRWRWRMAQTAWRAFSWQDGAMKATTVEVAMMAATACDGGDGGGG
jgi:hypothetical protein